MNIEKRNGMMFFPDLIRTYTEAHQTENNARKDSTLQISSEILQGKISAVTAFNILLPSNVFIGNKLMRASDSETSTKYPFPVSMYEDIALIILKRGPPRAIKASLLYEVYALLLNNRSPTPPAFILFSPQETYHDVKTWPISCTKIAIVVKSGAKLSAVANQYITQENRMILSVHLMRSIKMPSVPHGKSKIVA